jgi:peptide/nickel transport system substrate-binding protein
VKSIRLCVALCCLLACGACLERGGDKEGKAAELTQPAAEVVERSLLERIRSAEPQWPAKDNARVVIRLASEPLHLNPILVGDAAAVQVALGDIYEALLSIDKPGQRPRTKLAQSFVRDAEGKEWTFYLRRDVAFHSGQRMRPEDVVRSFELARDAPGPLQADFDDLESIRSEGSDAVVFRFLESRSSRSEAFASVPILSKKSFQGVSAKDLQRAKPSRTPNGTGPLRFSSWKSGTIELTRFQKYWGQRSRAKTIRYRVIADRTRALAELRSGGVDIVMRLPVDEALKGLEEDEEVDLVQETLPAYTAAVFNTASPKLGMDLRNALSRSFDRQTIIEQLYRGYSEAAHGPYTPASERNDPHTEPQAFDLESTKKELALLWPNPEHSLRLLVPAGSRTMERLADIWAEDLRGVVTIEIVKLPFADMLGRVRSGDFDVTLLSFTTSGEVDLYSLFHSSHVGNGNLSRLQDPAVDLLLDGARNAHSAEESRDRGRELHRLLMHLSPFAFLAMDRRLGLVARDVAGVGDGAERGGARNLWRRR